MRDYNHEIRSARDLDELCQVLNDIRREGLRESDYADLSDLPTFGPADSAPEDTSEIFSWDECHILVQWTDGDWAIEEREFELDPDVATLPGTIVARIGDICAEDHGGGVIYRDEHGMYHLEYTHGLECEHGGGYRDGAEARELRLEVYRVQLDDSLMSAVEPGSDDIANVANCHGLTPAEVERVFGSTEPTTVAGAWELWGSYFGWIEVDCYPESWRYGDIELRWQDPTP